MLLYYPVSATRFQHFSLKKNYSLSAFASWMTRHPPPCQSYIVEFVVLKRVSSVLILGTLLCDMLWTIEH